jgi:AcrR family transcriptional regulator
MARNPGNADQLMLQAAKGIIRKQGCAGLRVREVVDRAGVNLGMFHYHFKSKERFASRVLQEFYEEFFGRLSLAVQDESDPRVQLRKALIAVSSFVREEHKFYLALFRDVLSGDRQVIQFLQLNLPRHMSVFQELILRCQKEGKMVSLPVGQVMSFLMTSINFPILIANAHRLNRNAHFAAELEFVMSEKGTRQRIDLALKGLQP